jgi:hypothetical protein
MDQLPGGDEGIAKAEQDVTGLLCDGLAKQS